MSELIDIFADDYSPAPVADDGLIDIFADDAPAVEQETETVDIFADDYSYTPESVAPQEQPAQPAPVAQQEEFVPKSYVRLGNEGAPGKAIYDEMKALDEQRARMENAQGLWLGAPADAINEKAIEMDKYEELKKSMSKESVWRHNRTVGANRMQELRSEIAKYGDDQKAPKVLMDEYNKLNDDLHYDAEGFESRAMEGRATVKGVDDALYGDWRTGESGSMADALFGGRVDAIDRQHKKLNDVGQAVAKSLPQGDGFWEKASRGAAGSALPMAKSMVMALTSGGTLDKAYWARIGAGEIAHEWLNESGKKASDLSPEELSKLQNVARIGGAVYAAIEYASAVTKFGKQGFNLSDAFMKKFVKASANPTFLKKAADGGIRFIIKWLGETGEEGFQEATKRISKNVLDESDSILKGALSEGWKASKDAAGSTLFMTAGGNVVDVIGDKVNANKQALMDADAQANADAAQSIEQQLDGSLDTIAQQEQDTEQEDLLGMYGWDEMADKPASPKKKTRRKRPLEFAVDESGILPKDLRKARIQGTKGTPLSLESEIGQEIKQEEDVYDLYKWTTEFNEQNQAPALTEESDLDALVPEQQEYMPPNKRSLEFPTGEEELIDVFADDEQQTQPEGVEFPTGEEELFDVFADDEQQAQPDTPPVIKETRPMRRFAEKQLENEDLTEEQRDAIRNNPNNYVNTQTHAEIEDEVATMTRAEKLEALINAGNAKLEGNDNLGSIAGQSLMEEEVLAGRDPGWVIETLAKKSTTFAQLLSQYGRMKHAVPEVALSAFESDLAKNTGQALTEAQRNKLLPLIKRDMRNQAKYNELLKVMGEELSDKSIADVNRHARVVNKDTRELMNMYAQYSPKGLSDTYRDLIRGNLMSTTAHVMNTTGNSVMNLIYNGAKGVGSGVDAVLFNKNRSLRRPSVRGQLRGLKEGVKRGADDVLYGAGVDETLKGEPHRGFKPVAALKQLIKMDLPVKENGKVSKRTVGEKVVESTLGWFPEINFRALAFEDALFKFPLYRQEIEMEARARGLKGNAKEAFHLNPPRNVRNAAMEAAREGVFQSDSMAGRVVSRFRKDLADTIPVVGKAVDAAVLTPIMPYVTTIANMSKVLAKLALPHVTMSTGIAQMAYGKKSGSRSAVRRGEMNLGYATMGYILGGAATWLFSKGVVTGPPSDDKKEKTISYADKPPKKVNVSLLGRIKDGTATYNEDGTGVWMEGDELKSTQSLGFLDAILTVQAKKDENARKEKRQSGALADEENDQGWVADSANGGIAALQSILDTSILTGTINVLESVQDGSTDRLLKDYFRAATSVAPNTLSVLNRAKQKYLPDSALDKTGREGDVAWQALSNAVNERNLLIDWDKAYPHRYDPLGNVIKRTPDGVPRFLYHLVIKNESYNPDPVWHEIGNVYRETGNRSVIPSAAGRVLDVPKSIQHPYAGKKLPLLGRQYERMSELVGLSRQRNLKQLFASPVYKRAKPKGKAFMIDKAISRGSGMGRTMFINEFLERKRNALAPLGNTPQLTKPLYYSK